MVANKFLEELDMEDKMRAQCVSMCQHFHQSVRTLSDQYFATLHRQNYVTPTSYLEPILTFKSLLSKKRNEIVLMKKRYTVGLEKLEFAASSVRDAARAPGTAARAGEDTGDRAAHGED